MWKKSTHNCIVMSIGFAIIVLLLCFHLMDAINTLINDYNWIAQTTNRVYNTTHSEKEIFFFGEGFNNLNLLEDMIMAIIISLVILIVFLVIYWNEKSNQNREVK